MTPTNEDQPSRLTVEFMNGVLSGYLMGLEAGREQAEAEMAQLHAVAYETVQDAAKTPAYTEHQAAVRARQVASCEALKQEARPWPDEEPP